MEDIPAYARGSLPQTLQQIRALADQARWAEERGFADKQIAVKVIFELQKLGKAEGYAHVAGTDARALVDTLSAAAEALSLDNCCADLLSYYLDGVLPADHGAKFQPQVRLASLIATRGAEFLAWNESKRNCIDFIVHNMHMVIGWQNRISVQAMDYKTYESPVAGAV
ncbi:hypothetical protein BKA93DRAFT_748330 [Sparassis latifolia]